MRSFLKAGFEYAERGADRIFGPRLNPFDQLGALDARVAPVVIDLGREFARYQGYRPRFLNALDRVRAGEHDWFAKPTLDSYHTVWFQLHEDLLNTLGIERSKESTAT